MGDGPLVTARGIAAIRANPELRLTTGLFAAKNLGRGALTVLIVVVSLQLFEVGDSGVGWLNAAVGAGGVLGGIFAASLVGRRRLGPPMLLGILLWGVAFLAIGVEPLLAVAIAALVVLGIGNSVTDVAGYTLVGRSARDDVLARVYGVHEAIRALAITAGAGLTALVVALAGVRASLFAAGGLLAAVAVAGLLRRRAETAEPSAEYLDVLRSNPIFAWLAPVGLERLASSLEPLELEAGAVLLHQGDRGDRAYLLAAGEMVARLDGREIGRIRAGEVAGEIALLHDAPRNATVTALTHAGCLRSIPTSSLQQQRVARPRERRPRRWSRAESRPPNDCALHENSMTARGTTESHEARSRRSRDLLRAVALIGTVPFALLVGTVTDSEDALVAVLALGVVASVILRLAVPR